MAHQRRFDRTARVGSWMSLGDGRLVRVVELEPMRWQLAHGLDRYRYAASSLGGPIALYPNGLLETERGADEVFLYSSGGAASKVAPVVRLAAPHPGAEAGADVLHLSWNVTDDHLIVVLRSGTVHFFHLNGSLAAPSTALRSPKLFSPVSNGLVVLTEEEDGPHVVLLEYYADQKAYVPKHTTVPVPTRAEGAFFATSSSLLGISQESSDSAFVEAYLLYTVPSSGATMVFHSVFNASPRCHDRKATISGGRALATALSPSGERVAFLLEDGTLCTTTRSFGEVTSWKAPDAAAGVATTTTTAAAAAAHMAWCGERCIAHLAVSDTIIDGDLRRSATLHLSSADDPDYTDFIDDVPPDTRLVQECDGVRLVSAHRSRFLQAVPPPVRRVFSVASKAPAARLVSAFDAFMSGGDGAVGMITALQQHTSELIEAIDDCVCAAAYEFDVNLQKRLLRIARFGKSFCAMYDTDLLVSVVQRLRVLNTLRTGEVGWVLSEAQFLELGEERLLQRLTACHHHHVAYSICDQLQLPSDDVMADWALAKLSQMVGATAGGGGGGAEDERAAARWVAKRLRKCKCLAFAELAEAANLRGRRAAALVFLDAEPVASRQVLTLLRIHEPEVALRRAAAAGDSDLLFTAMLFLLRASQGSSRAIQLITSIPEARDQLIGYVQGTDGHRELLREYLRTNPHCDTNLFLRNSFQEERNLDAAIASGRRDVSWEMRQEGKTVAVQSAIVSAMREAEQAVGSSLTNKATGGGGGVASSVVPIAHDRFLRKHLEVIDEQTALMKQLDDTRFLNASIAEMVRFVLEHGRVQVGERLKAKFSVPDRMFQWCMLTAYANTRRWDLIDELGAKTVLSGDSFVSVLVSHGRPQQAAQYIPRIASIEQRMELYVTCDDWQNAAADCKRQGDPDLLQQLRARAKGNADYLRLIESGWNSATEAPRNTLAKFFGGA